METGTNWLLAVVGWLVTSGWGPWVAGAWTALLVVTVAWSWVAGRDAAMDRKWERLKRKRRRMQERRGRRMKR